ncbi:MAG TPA: Glu/Leu/Phe/Val dehydrogenase, partial [Candidatus Dormibacteraeota bacterium]|nr:Glu/Leu/Phe/Val dehydrogenase [Candidatus Dormibacteraeota bacterium]
MIDRHLFPAKRRVNVDEEGAYALFCATVDAASAVAGITDAAVLERIKRPERVHEVSIPLVRDDGRRELLTGYRVQHSSARGPYKGGIRYHPRVCLDEVKALAGWMSIKTAVVNIPMGGGKGGITVDPHSLSLRELEALTRAYTERVWRVIGPLVDIPAPDVNTDSRVMDWIADEYGRLSGLADPAVVTGKTVEHGGSLGRDKATARGGFDVLEAALKASGDDLKGKRVAIQGFGNAGANAAVLFEQAGAVIVAASDSTAAVLSPSGLSAVELAAYKARNAHFCDMTGVEKRHAESPLYEDVDILVPAALESQITAENAGRIQARWIVELANGPTTPEADVMLADRGVNVLPDILANAGGVVVSYFEWVQDLHSEKWLLEEVEA